MVDQSTCCETRYGKYVNESRERLVLTYLYENGTLYSFFHAARHLCVDVFMDICANIGCYSVFLGSQKSIKKIYAFEPAPESFRQLEQNIFLQEDRERFRAIRMGVSDSKSEQRFLIVSQTAGNNRIVSNTQGETIAIQCDTLDSLVSMEGKRIALKIDVEGHEIKALAGMTKLLKDNTCLLQVECLNFELASRAQKILFALGYRLLFVLRDDYIFISGNLEKEENALRGIYFTYLKKELQELLDLRTYKRDTINRLSAALHYAGYPYNPIDVEKN